MSKRWIILDCNYLCHRAKYTTGQLTHGGTPTGTIFGFLKEVLSFRTQFHPYGIVFCFDSRYSRRAKIYPAYKKGRAPKNLTKEEEEFERGFHQQVRLLRTDYLPQIGFKNILCQKGYESDDLIASTCLAIRNPDRATIITCDQDLYQCIRPNIDFYDPRRKYSISLESFYDGYGILPDAWITVKAIAGCKSDNIKGIPGVGETTVIKWLKADLKPSSVAFKKINEYAWQIRLRNSVLIALPFPGTKKPKLQADKLSQKGWREVCKQLGFKSIAGGLR
jgi:DNA polymerase-1